MLDFLKKPTIKKKESIPEAKISKKERSENLKQLRAEKKTARENAKKHFWRLKQLERSTEKQNDYRKKVGRELSAPDSSQKTIRYNRMFDNGLCEVGEGIYSKSIMISDINYQIARLETQKNIFSRYCEVLNYFESTISMQLSVINRRIDADDFRKLLMSEQSDSLDIYRKELNDMLEVKAMEGFSGIRREKYITFAVESTSRIKANQSLARIEADITGEFRSLGCEVKPLSGHERLELLHSMTCPDEKFEWNYNTLIESGLTTKDIIAPSSYDFTEKSIFMFGDKTGQVLFLKDLPADMSDRLITALSDLPINLSITMHIKSYEQDKAFSMVKSKISFMEQQKIDEQKKALKSGYDAEMLSYELRYSLDEAQELLDHLQNKNQKLFKTTILVYTYADTKEELSENIYQIMAEGRKFNCRFAPLDLMQEEGINSVYPLGKNHVPVSRTLTTASTAIFIPFTTQELYQDNGVYYGQNALSRNMIILNRKSLKAPNGWILGTPGSGKSFAAKREIINLLLSDPDAEVLVIDPEQEYVSLCENLGGETIRIAANSRNYINPFDITLDYSDDDNPLLLKREFITSLCEVLTGETTPKQKSLIDRACRITYQKYLMDPKRNEMPTLKDFYDTLKMQPEQEAQSLALDLEIYTEGSLSVFANQTNVDTENRFIVFDIKDLGKQLKTLGMLIVLDQIWNRITRNRAIGKRTWIYIDEIQLLFTNDYSANYFFELWSRSRKWGAIPTGITQNVETLLLSDLARRMLSNSEFIMMLRQSAPDKAELAALLDISDQQLNYVTNNREGEGLIFAGNAIIPFEDQFNKNTRLYRMITTKPEEVTEMQRKLLTDSEPAAASVPELF